jgi:hypothetical protein
MGTQGTHSLVSVATDCVFHWLKCYIKERNTTTRGPWPPTCAARPSSTSSIPNASNMPHDTLPRECCASQSSTLRIARESSHAPNWFQLKANKNILALFNELATNLHRLLVHNFVLLFLPPCGPHLTRRPPGPSNQTYLSLHSSEATQA